MRIVYDQGTLVVENEPPDVPFVRPRSLSFLRWDDRVDRWRCFAQRLPDLLGWAEQHGRVAVVETPRPRNFHLRFVRADALPSLRGYQQSALESWLHAGRRGLVSLPTGSGKTRVAIHAIFRSALPTLVVAPTRQLVEQWRTSLANLYHGPVGVFSDGRREIHPITVATYASAHLHVDRFGAHFDFLVLDEAHHLCAERWQEIIQMCVARQHLALTATPPIEPVMRSQVENLVGRVCYELSTASLVGKPLANLESRVLPVELSPDERKVYRVHRHIFEANYRLFCSRAEAGEERAWTDYVRWAHRAREGREALRAYRRARRTVDHARRKIEVVDELLDRHARDPVLVFVADNASAYRISRELLIPAITCEIGRKERERILERFATGELGAITSSKVLDEGIDVPAATVAVLVGASGGTRRKAQRVGRVLRPFPGKSSALVYEILCVDTVEWRRAWARREHDAAVPTAQI